MARLTKEFKAFLTAAVTKGSLTGEDNKTPSAEVNADAAGKLYYGDPKIAEALAKMKPPLVVCSSAMKDASGNIATLVTKEGVAEVEKASAPKTPRKAPEPLPAPSNPDEIEIETGIPFPEARRGRGAAPSPWNTLIEKLPVGGSFFIAVSETVPEPWKRYASVAQSATKRFNKEGSTDRRRFAIKEAEKNGAKGARIWRLEDAKPGTTADQAQAQAATAQPVGATGVVAGFSAS